MTTLNPVDHYNQPLIARRSPRAAWSLAVLGGLLLAVDPVGLGGARVFARPGQTRKDWGRALDVWLGIQRPLISVSAHVTHEQLVGGIDIAETLKTKSPHAVKGALERAHGGLLMLRGAQTLDDDRISPIVDVLDRGQLKAESGGLVRTVDLACGCVAFDEGLGRHEPDFPAELGDRLALILDLDAGDGSIATMPLVSLARLQNARGILSDLTLDPSAVNAVCRVAADLGVTSLRAPSLALNAARAHAALFGRTRVAFEDLEVAVALVLVPRARRRPRAGGEVRDENGELQALSLAARGVRRYAGLDTREEGGDGFSDLKLGPKMRMRTAMIGLGVFKRLRRFLRSAVAAFGFARRRDRTKHR